MESARIRVCLLIDTLGVDAGTERLVAETALRLDPAAIDVHVCCLEDSKRLQELKGRCKVGIFPAIRINSWNGLRQIRAFRQYLTEMRIDVMHAFMNRTAILGVAARSGTGCKAIVTSRLSIDWYTPSLQRFFRYYMNPRTTRIFANSEGVKRFVMAAENAPAAKIDVIYQGVDVARFSAHNGDVGAAVALGIPPAAKVVGIVANYRPIKDLPLFLRAAKLVAAEVPDAAFLLVGAGSLYTELTDLARQLGIGDVVFFSNGKGKVSDYLSRLSVAALSSESEGFSNAILEYMAAGLPVVATDVGGNAEAIQHEATGYLVKDRDPAAFAAPIIELLRNDELRGAMGRCSAERCRRLFSMETYITRLESYYRALAEPA